LIGVWKNSELWGEGERRSAKGEIYTGKWENGKLNGQGRMESPAGKYTGNFKDNEESGYGKMVRAKLWSLTRSGMDRW
jgi:hypothetical protein